MNACEREHNFYLLLISHKINDRQGHMKISQIVIVTNFMFKNNNPIVLMIFFTFNMISQTLNAQFISCMSKLFTR